MVNGGASRTARGGDRRAARIGIQLCAGRKGAAGRDSRAENSGLRRARRVFTESLQLARPTHRELACFCDSGSNGKFKVAFDDGDVQTLTEREIRLAIGDPDDPTDDVSDG